MKPLTTEPPLDPPVTREDETEWRRYKMHKQNLIDEEQLYDSLEEKELILQMEHESMQWLDDDDEEQCELAYLESGFPLIHEE